MRLQPEEFDAIYGAYVEDREATYRNGWEQLRLLGAITIAPHVKHAPSPQALLPLPWDKSKRRLKTDVEILSKEEAIVRFENRVKALK